MKARDLLSARLRVEWHWWGLGVLCDAGCRRLRLMCGPLHLELGVLTLY